MANNIDTSNITVGQPTEGGCIYWDEKNTATLPTDATTALAAGFESLGDVSENGFTESNPVEVTNHKDWGGDVVVSTIDSEETTFKVELLEVNRAAAAKAYYGVDAVTVDAQGFVKAIDYKARKVESHPFVIEELETSGNLRRTVIRKGTVTSLDDVPHQKGSLMLYGMTITAAKPANGLAKASVYREAVASE